MSLLRSLYASDNYIFDEPEANLDVDSKQIFNKYVDCISGMKIIITHDLDNLNDDDKVLYLKEGNLIYKGNYSGLKEVVDNV